MSAPEHPTSVVLSRHAFRRTARAKKAQIEEVRSHYLEASEGSYKTWLRNSKDYHDLRRNVPAWAKAFRVERAGRGPFSWVVRAYDVPPAPRGRSSWGARLLGR